MYLDKLNVKLLVVYSDWIVLIIRMQVIPGSPSSPAWVQSQHKKTVGRVQGLDYFPFRIIGKVR